MHVRKMRRSERSEDIRQRLFLAATKVVGEVGYADASIARITQEAGFAQGTFYNYFPTRQALLDELLPVLGRRMVRFIEDRVDASAGVAGQEDARFRAFFDFLDEFPEFLRILNEAEFFAPAGYRIHMARTAGAYGRILREARQADGRTAQFSDEEIDLLVHILMGARGYVGRVLAGSDGRVATAPDHVFTAYTKLLCGGLFDPQGDGRPADAGRPKTDGKAELP